MYTSEPLRPIRGWDSKTRTIFTAWHIQSTWAPMQIYDNDFWNTPLSLVFCNFTYMFKIHVYVKYIFESDSFLRINVFHSLNL